MTRFGRGSSLALGSRRAADRGIHTLHLGYARRRHRSRGGEECRDEQIGSTDSPPIPGNFHVPTCKNAARYQFRQCVWSSRAWWLPEHWKVEASKTTMSAFARLRLPHGLRAERRRMHVRIINLRSRQDGGRVCSPASGDQPNQLPLLASGGSRLLVEEPSPLAGEGFFVSASSRRDRDSVVAMRARHQGFILSGALFR